MSQGVSITDLHCPSCGAPYKGRLQAEYEEPDPLTCSDTFETIALPRPRPFIRCPNGHKWTIKAIWRCLGKPDEVLLGVYIGGGQDRINWDLD